MTPPLPVHGADVSHHQGALNLQKAAEAGLKFLYHKATEGTTFKDPEYVLRRRQAAEAGIPFGAYHFARPDGRDAKAEARFFIETAKPRPGDLVPCLDMEVPGNWEQWSRDFMAEVERLVSCKPLHYGPNDYGKDYPYLRWVPRYNDSNTRPTIPWDIWQFSNGVLGLPNSFPGLGHVDLNVMREGLRLRRLIIPRGEQSDPKKDFRLHLMHASMQYSDPTKQQTVDAEEIFARAEDRKVAWITGTEAGAEDFREIIEEAANRHGYRFFARNRNDSWIAIRRDLIKGNVDVEYEVLLQASDGFGRHGPRGVLCVSFDSVPELGRVTVLATHYLTRGRPGAKDPDYRVNVPHNRKLAMKTGELARKHGKGSALVFFGGDQNIVDRDEDTFMGEPLTSSWDELEKYENTGHGNIDVIASYDRDSRVEAVYCRALDDREFFLHGDHFLVESGYDVAPLAA